MTATQAIRTFGRYRHVTDVPDLTEIQRKAYEEFLMVETPQATRPIHGLEELLREVFPIYSYDKTMCLEYVGYELGRPRYTIDECRKLRLTFGFPFKVRLRLTVLFLGLTVLLSTFVLGIHWIPDIVAGGAVGTLGVVLARRFDLALRRTVA